MSTVLVNHDVHDVTAHESNVSDVIVHWGAGTDAPVPGPRVECLLSANMVVHRSHWQARTPDKKHSKSSVGFQATGVSNR